MSLDGSFSCKFALERFLARCPKIQNNPNFISLLQKVDGLNEEEVVNSLAELFLHPHYTIPMMGCFRPISRKILDKAVDLLRLVPSLKLESGNVSLEIGEDDIHVIGFYHRVGRTLRLHELASLAFCRALDLAPFLLGCILCYFGFAPPPFQRLLMMSPTPELSEKDAAHLLESSRASFRFLLMEPKVFSNLWDWSCFLDVVQLSENVTSGDDSVFSKNILDIKWCGIQILSFILKMSDRSTVNFRLGAEKALTCFFRWDEFCQDVALEKAGLYLEASVVEAGNGTIDLTQAAESFYNSSLVSFSACTHQGEPKMKKCRKASSVMEFEKPFVLTSSMKKCYEMVLLAMNQKWPILLHGPTGSGKTAMINKLAQVHGNQVLFLHMDEQMDGKTLIGSYISAEQPGEFRWQPGSLTQALGNGYWVVFEDIDKASAEVQSFLLPLLEGASSYVTGHGEAIKVAESFRLFATVSSSNHDYSQSAEGTVVFGVLWRRVMVAAPSSKDLSDIIKTWYPCLDTLAEKLIDTFNRVNSVASFQIGGFQVGRSTPNSFFCRFSSRDLLKWCKRIAGLGFSFSGHGLLASDCKNIYQEAVDIFAVSSASSDNHLAIMKEIAHMWGVPSSEAENIYPPYRPVIQDSKMDLQVGRVTLKCTQRADTVHHLRRVFVELHSSLHLLERIACSVKYNEPVLLVGETGTGKTTLVQNLAMRLGQPLTVLNLSQQSDVSDLLGGFKPTDARFICIPLYEEFRDLFCETFSERENKEYLLRCERFAVEKNWKLLFHALNFGWKFFCKYVNSGRSTKRKRPLGKDVIHRWDSFFARLDAARKHIGATMMSFSFVEGAFITALKNGHWILLDEINLAPPETLQRIIGVLEGEKGTLCLAERGDVQYIDRHSSFRIFACMNPATDAGKRDLPYSIRSRFTEYFVDDILDDEDLTLFVKQYMDPIGDNRKHLDRVVCFYKKAKVESEERLLDGANQKPQFSLRSLARALEYTRKAMSISDKKRGRKFDFHEALYDGFCMFFLTLLDQPSARIMNNMIITHLLGGKMPKNIHFARYLFDNETFDSVSDDDAFLERYIQSISRPGDDAFLESYVRTESIDVHMRNLTRAVLIKRYPVLLQGPTSSGKTSLVRYLARVTGHKFVRINNHEHTDLQEYFGSYVTDFSGKLAFQEGILVKAVRNGYWIVLDELNLAPSDVLEALNRLLDDNREIFVPELQETVTAHPDFMLFATQNPPTLYGGRKMLSRAFRNRFLEIHVDDIPENELRTILERRCKIPNSYAGKMVNVMKDLQLRRQGSNVFAGKHGFITPRDLFRWADRFREFGTSYEDLAKDGYFLLAERLRDESEKDVVQEVLERHLNAKLIKDDLYLLRSADCNSVKDLCKHSGLSENTRKIVWTKSMWRLFFLIERCYKLREPVLLVGETGGGKTTVCELLSTYLGSTLHTLNCHQYTETSDFLGGFYPVRGRSKLAMEFKCCVETLKLSKVFVHFLGDYTISSDISHASTTLEHLNAIISSYTKDEALHPEIAMEDFDAFQQAKLDLMELQRKWNTVFMWQDGPLVEAMKEGDVFLVDEISLADDSVLERLNSVLEPERELTLAEKGGPVLETITAHPNFFLLATMNPGGDYGKKELSPALRNRFTEIWVPPVSDVTELRNIALERFHKSEHSCIVDSMLKFWEWFNQLQTGRILTVRDLLSWIDFLNATQGNLGSETALIHGAFLVLLDGLSLGSGISRQVAENLRERCLSFLLEHLQGGCSISLSNSQLSKIENYGWGDTAKTANTLFQSDLFFGIDPFFIAKGDKESKHERFEFLAPTTCRNALRVLRALQVPRKPVLLEGSPGVGKTSLVVALADFSGHAVVRINLSEQTDMMDLLGSDLPVEGEKGMKFAWSDGILLQALKKGSWVLLDELNLAPQSVLEGLNAILDHRGEVYIPELGTTFSCPPSFRVFACQNPSSQGGGRKGLPKSFLNRFTKVYVDELVEDDYLFICSSLYPSITKSLLSKLIHFNHRLYEDTMLFGKYGQDGSPWEFNLRDVIRSCQMIECAPEKSKVDCFLNVVYVERMRTLTDRKKVLNLFEEVFEFKPFVNEYPRVQTNPEHLIVGSAVGKRNHFQPTKTLKGQLYVHPGISHSLEAALHCVQHQWLCILVGPSSSGKTSLVRSLAQLTGNALHELNLSSGTDISELLGCFEQYSAYRNFSAVISQVEQYINEYCCLLSERNPELLMTERKDLISSWLSILSSMNHSSSMAASAATFATHLRSGNCNLLDSLVEIIESLKLDLDKYQLSASWSSKDLSKSLMAIIELQETSRTQSFCTKFEWVAGGLIKAIERGEWVLLENANLCNPTVLDRINSLVEPSGLLTINECGLVDGKPVVLHAHPNFRMFLTMNPKYGEVSRAMRNRGVEVFMMQPHGKLGDANDYDCKDPELRDLKRFLILSGIPVWSLVDVMAKVHIYSRDAGQCLGKHISLLDLTRWVQLFQQLLMNGNRTSWSLHVSWEHSYLSSFGEAEGMDIVNYVKDTYLLSYEPSKLDRLLGCSLALPGGWPSLLNLRNFVWCSLETCIRQNCLYLEYLGAQVASYNLSLYGKKNLQMPVQSLTAVGDGKKLIPSIIPVDMICCLLFPTSNQESLVNVDRTDFDLTTYNNMLFFAANWVIEQATESDLMLYVLWFEWYSTQLHPYCRFFRSFVNILKREREHPIWKCIFGCWKEVASYLTIDRDKNSLPLLSFELVELAKSSEALEILGKKFYNAVQSVNLLRRSLQQWKAEDDYAYNEEKIRWSIDPVLKSLRHLEAAVLNGIVEYSCIDLYTNVIESHILFWKGVTAFEVDLMLISWRSLRKAALKLRNISLDLVNAFLEESKNLEGISSLDFYSSKSMLWIHGGHPILPSSADVYYKMQQLLRFCDDIWPLKLKSLDQIYSEKSFLSEVFLAANVELRQLVLQGLCMSSYITGRGDQEEIDIVHQLEEILQMLLLRFKNEKCELEKLTANIGNDSVAENKASECCSFRNDMLCSNPGFESWLEILSLHDSKSLSLDLDLLEELSRNLLVNDKELYLSLASTSESLEYALNFSLSFSSRSPTCFLSHQKILWILDAWTSIDHARAKIVCLILEMWFRWHSSLWSYSSKQFKIIAEDDYNQICVPDALVKPTKTVLLDQILQGLFPVQNYSMHCLKLRVASESLWKDAPSGRGLASTLLSTARCLFQQIVFAHQKSFEEDKIREIKSLFHYVDENSTHKKQEELESLLKGSSHQGLISLIGAFVKPILRGLYSGCSSDDGLYHLGNAWLHIGGLRYHLLLNPNEPDPALKHAIKHAQLVEKISLLELENKVRQECNHLAGRNSARDDDKQRMILLKKLEMDRKRMQTKLVFRPNPSKFKKLKSECSDFLELVKFSHVLVKNLELGDINQLLVDEACNWQETSASFINQLSEKYPTYVDVIQPIQVAIYEMKLGLSLVLSSALQKAFLKKVGGDNIHQVQEAIFSLMQFPRGCTDKTIPPGIKITQPQLMSSDVDTSSRILGMDVDLLNKLFTIPRDTIHDKAVSNLQSQAGIYHIMLVRVTLHICTSFVINNASLMLLDKIFEKFASLWMDMQLQVKAKEDDEAQQYRFRPRAFNIEEIFNVDISPLQEFGADDNLSSEWHEMPVEQDTHSKPPAEEHDDLAEEWDRLHNSIFFSMVHTHNQLFGSENLVEHTGKIQITDEEKLQYFVDSYKLGAPIMKDMLSVHSSSLDGQLLPEHLLRLCLEYKHRFSQPHKSTQVYNFYQDPNAPVLAQMVKPLASLQEKVKSLMSDWPDHPGLQNILDAIGMLLTLPSDTPLAKGLSGLQILVKRAQILQENAPKFSLADKLQPIFALVYSWHKLELDSWPALLDEVLKQYEVNAGKLWFPLYSVLHRKFCGNIDAYNLSTIQSLEDFIHTASVGEFKKRLALLLAFHCQLNTDICLKSNSSFHMMESSKILYNFFGYYVQFLPLISEHIETSRRKIETEIKEILKLSQWEQTEWHLSVETSQRTRQKLSKLIQKFNGILQESVMNILSKEDMQEKFITQTSLEQEPTDDSHDTVMELLPKAVQVTQFSEAGRSLWYGDFIRKISSASENLCSQSTLQLGSPDLCLTDFKEVADMVWQSLSSGNACEIYQEAWISLQKICRSATEFAYLFKHEKKSLRKRRALAGLLKVLEGCGLSRHRSIVSEEGFNSRTWLLPPSYDVQHLLLSQSGVFSTSVKSTNLESQAHKKDDSNWELANCYYFKNISFVQKLRQLRLSFHRSLSLEQVNSSASFLDHLIVIQQDQRSVAYNFADQLKKLRKCMSSLKELGLGADTKCSMTPNQLGTYNCMWQQKELFDTLYAMSTDALLLLRTVETTHLNTCNTVRNEADGISIFINRFIPKFQKAKESLDLHLIGSNGTVTTPSEWMPPFIVSVQMEDLVVDNFKIIKSFEDGLWTTSKQTFERSVKELILSRFGSITDVGKVIAEEFHSKLERVKQCMSDCEDGAHSSFAEIYEGTIKLILDAFQKMGLLIKDHTVSESSLDRVTTLWEVHFESCIRDLQIDVIYDALGRTIIAAAELVNEQPKICSQVQNCLTYIHVLLDLVLTFAEGLLLEFLAMHKTVAEMTHMLAHIFASLYSRGLAAAEEQTDDAGGDLVQNASGTGMGEGEGLNDVSEQIDDEDQLLGASTKQSEGTDTSKEVPGSTQRGIEMDEDFAGDTFSISEDSGDDECKDDEDVNLDSVMGEATDGNEIVDEKLWDKDEDGNMDNTQEKYETGPSIRETDVSSRELRAKKDTVDDSGELNHDESERLSEREEGPDFGDDKDDENTDNINMDKDNAFGDPTGIQLNEQNQDFEDMSIDEPKDSGPVEEAESDSATSEDTHGADEMTKTDDELTNEAEDVQMDVQDNTNEPGGEHTQSTDMDLAPTSKEEVGPGETDSSSLNADSSKPLSVDHWEDSTLSPKMNFSNSSDLQNGLAPSRGLSLNDAGDTEITMPDSNQGKMTTDRPKSQLPPDDTSTAQRSNANPYRSVGSALDEWKERIKVSTDSLDHKSEVPEDQEDENVDEYGFVSREEEGTSQALGPATSDQIDQNINSNKPNPDEGPGEERDIPSEMEIEKENAETHHISSSTALGQKIKEQLVDMEVANVACGEAASPEVDDFPGNQSLDLVTMNKSYMNEILNVNNLSMSDQELGKANTTDEIYCDMEDNATELWRRYELTTTRLSQELAEQLRAVMEPNQASKLQGDYKTGKRINMKKVISYIASHFRKDKIWLRRTKPNKRDYQVIVAVDDSRSMSESHCGSAAIEALVTVCRAMSQLEVGQLAVASFGKKGNIRLLHDFDRQFNAEAGVKVISSLTFKQDNQISSDPMVELLKYLNNKLDAAAATVRLPSGQNPLQQLILIIGDGIFQEKENLKRCVRDALSRKQMIAYLLLDHSKDSIIDSKEAVNEGTGFSFQNYLDSFPFPYYVVLRNIEGLPRTLADLLRQWFELMQNTRE